MYALIKPYDKQSPPAVQSFLFHAVTGAKLQNDAT